MTSPERTAILSPENIAAAEAHIERAIEAGRNRTDVPHLTAAGVLFHVVEALTQLPEWERELLRGPDPMLSDPWRIHDHHDEPPF